MIVPEELLRKDEIDVRRFHDSTKFKLEVKSSLLPDAGNGCFTTVAREKNSVIGVYGGRLLYIDASSDVSLDDQLPDSDRIQRVDVLDWKDFEGYVVGDHTSATCFINHANIQAHANVKLITPTQTETNTLSNMGYLPSRFLKIVALRDLEAGEELLRDCGWKTVENRQFGTSRAPGSKRRSPSSTPLSSPVKDKELKAKAQRAYNLAYVPNSTIWTHRYIVDECFEYINPNYRPNGKNSVPEHFDVSSVVDNKEAKVEMDETGEDQEEEELEEEDDDEEEKDKEYRPGQKSPRKKRKVIQKQT